MIDDPATLLPPEARRVLSRVPRHLRDDAIGEGLLALAEGKDPAKAIDAWRKRELRHEAHERSFTDVGFTH